MKPYQQSQHQVSQMPQRDHRERMVFIASILAIIVSVCISIADSGETPAPVQIASK